MEKRKAGGQADMARVVQDCGIGPLTQISGLTKFRLLLDDVPDPEELEWWHVRTEACIATFATTPRPANKTGYETIHKNGDGDYEKGIVHVNAYSGGGGVQHTQHVAMLATRKMTLEKGKRLKHVLSLVVPGHPGG